MNKIEEFDPEAILEDLSYSIASAPADAVMKYLRHKQFQKAENILIEEGVSENNAKKLVEYLYKKISKSVDLIEISISEINKTDFEQQYIYRLGESLIKASLYNRHDGHLYFLGDGDKVKFEEVDQVWKIIPKNL